MLQNGAPMQIKAVGDLAVGSRQEFPLVMAAMPINEREKRIALGVVIFLLSVVVIVAPFANTPLAHIDVFVPVLQTAMCVVDLVTAALLLAQYTIFPKHALLVVASGYVLSGLFAFIQTLAFPGAYSATGLIGDGINSAAWIFVLWHSSFAIAVIVYALTKDAKEAASLSDRSAAATMGIAIACILAATVGLTIGTVYLPNLFISVTRQTRLANSANVFLWLLSVTAFVLLFVRRRTILDLWLMVILLAWWPTFALGIFVTDVRFSLGWYALRCFGLVASSTLLCVLLGETIALYARLANAIVLLRREQETKIMSAQAITAAIAHEIRQPLTRITAGGGAAQRFLKMVPPQLDKAQAALGGVVNAGHSTSAVIDGFRSIFGKADEEQQLVDMNELIPEVLESLDSQLKDHRVSVRVDLTPKLPPVSGNKGQLQEVVFNLIMNSIEAMETATVEGRVLRIQTETRDDKIAVAVEDSGPGIDKDQLGELFTAFVTTKRHGMGLGLAISRMIIEYHGGKLTASSDSKIGGASFQFVLPIADRR